MSQDNRRQVNCRYQLLPDNTAPIALFPMELNANSVCYRFSKERLFYFYYTKGGWQIMGLS